MDVIVPFTYKLIVLGPRATAGMRGPSSAIMAIVSWGMSVQPPRTNRSIAGRQRLRPTQAEGCYPTQSVSKAVHILCPASDVPGGTEAVLHPSLQMRKLSTRPCVTDRGPWRQPESFVGALAALLKPAGLLGPGKGSSWVTFLEIFSVSHANSRTLQRGILFISKAFSAM